MNSNKRSFALHHPDMGNVVFQMCYEDPTLIRIQFFARHDMPEKRFLFIWHEPAFDTHLSIGIDNGGTEFRTMDVARTIWNMMVKSGWERWQINRTAAMASKE